ncbi:hypothetical protein B2J88_31585 [Rhodococcus sp. SRB_17]|nr:hypothetical protein [Rhodococcus sp. SRB_17]
MADEPKHLIYARFTGTAELESPEHGVSLLNASVEFDAQALEFTVLIPASHPLVDCLAQERRSVPLRLQSVSLGNQDIKVRMHADQFLLSRRNALSEWPECFGREMAALCEGDDGVRRLVLGPTEYALEFQLDCPVSEQYPFQHYYGDACKAIQVAHVRAFQWGKAEVHFASVSPQDGIVCAYSTDDLAPIEPRIHAGLMLCHGRDLPRVLSIEASKVVFFGYRPRNQVSTFPLSSEARFALMGHILEGVCCLSEAAFRSAFLALKFFVAGKQADVALEARYMLLMTCVEAMDGEHQRQLSDASTAALLGVSRDAARLFNGMRNELVHGRGGYKEAFTAFWDTRCKEGALQLEPELAPCVREGAELDFARLWIRLCERLDAFWCAYLKVPADLLAYRYEHRYAPLMRPVDVNVLDQVNSLPKAAKSGETKRNQELLDANRRLKAEKEDLKRQLRTQGQKIAQLKRIAAEHGVPLDAVQKLAGGEHERPFSV